MLLKLLILVLEGIGVQKRKEKERKQEEKKEGKSYLLRCCKYVSEAHTEGNHEVGFVS
jgi:hypothetical protein